jgi:hypothetical protein
MTEERAAFVERREIFVRKTENARLRLDYVEQVRSQGDLTFDAPDALLRERREYVGLGSSYYGESRLRQPLPNDLPAEHRAGLDRSNILIEERREVEDRRTLD